MKTNLLTVFRLNKVNSKGILFSLFMLFSLLQGSSVFAQARPSIAVTNVSSTPVCAGTTVTLTFTAFSGNGVNRYDVTSNYTAYLSSSAGGAPYTSIGTFTNTSYSYGGNGSNNTGVTGTVTIPSNTAGGTGYRISIGSTNPTFNGSAGAGASAAFTINAASVGGTVSGSSTVCSGTNSTAFTLSGHTGSVTKWQSSPVSNFASGVSDIANTTTSLTATNLTSTTYYRAVVTNATCASANSSVATVTVNPVSVGGTVSGGTTVCSGTNSTTLTLSGHVGSVTKWQYSPVSDFSSGVTDVANTTTTLTATNLTSIRYYRAVVTSGVCASADSASATIAVDTPSVGGSVSGDSTVCSGTNSTTFTLSGHTGSITKWQSSPVSDFSAGVSDIANTTASLTATNLTSTTYYRAVVTNGVCSSANSTSGLVTVDPVSVGGTVSGSTSVCFGTNSTNLTLSGHSGSVTKWQSSPVSDFSSGVSDIANTTTSLTAIDLISTTYYRAVVTSGVCASANSSVATITVDVPSVGGTVSGDSTVCTGTNSTTFTLSGSTGIVTKWQSSSVSDFSSGVSDIANTTTSLTVTNLTSTTYYRAVVTNGTCSSANSSTGTVTVTPASIGGSVASNQVVCSGNTPADLTLSGHLGSVVRWESDTNAGFTSPTTIANTTTTLTGAAIGAITSTTYFRAIVQNGVCTEIASAAASISIETTTWNGSAWSNGTPDGTKTIAFTGNYTAASDLSGCALTVSSSAVVTIPSGYTVTLEGAITVGTGSTFTLENNANLLQGGTSNTNSGNIVVKRNSSLLKRLDYTLWSAPVAGQQLQSFSANTFSNRFYTYDTNTNLYTVVASPSTTNFATATGYLIRVPNTHPSITPTSFVGQFTGVPNNGDYTFTMTNGGSGQRFNLVGNPYPSPIDATDFVTDNSANITGTLYFWRKTNNSASPSYCTWTTAGFVDNGEAETYDPNGIIRTGQGFFVEASGSATTVDFTNTMRVDDTANQFFRAAPVERNRIWLDATSTTGDFSQTMVGYMAGATNGIDPRIDGRYINDGTIALTSLINTTPYAIQGRALPFVSTDEVPLSFSATVAGTYSISLNRFDGLFNNPNKGIYLKDNQSDVIHDLRSGAYSFTADSGSTASRFELVFQTNYYQDADGDSYGNSLVSQLADSQPSGYVLDATDCNDQIAAINPGETEILYNGVDENCNAIMDEGFQIISNMVNCGTTLTTIGSLIYCVSTPGVNGYRFEVTNTLTNAVQTIDKPYQYFSLTELTNYEYATTYSVRVMVRKTSNNVWLGYYGAPCLYSTPPVTSTTGGIGSTQLQTYCGETLPTISTIISTTSLPGATGYRFRVTNTNTGVIQTLTRNLHWFSLTMLASYNYGTTYVVDVAVKTTGDYSDYGAPCNLTTPESPTLVNYCGNALVPTKATLITTRSLDRVTAYEFTVEQYDEALQLLSSSIVVKSLNRFSFNDITNYASNTTYSVKVRVFSSGTWSPYGDACQIVSPGAAKQGVDKEIVNANAEFTVVGYPNPYDYQFSLHTEGLSESPVSIKVYDMIGKLIETREINASEMPIQSLGERYSSGVYNVVVTQGDYVKTLRIIKR